jgi:hypothetical protein
MTGVFVRWWAICVTVALIPSMTKTKQGKSKTDKHRRK